MANGRKRGAMGHFPRISALSEYHMKYWHSKIRLTSNGRERNTETGQWRDRWISVQSWYMQPLGLISLKIIVKQYTLSLYILCIVLKESGAIYYCHEIFQGFSLPVGLHRGENKFKHLPKENKTQNSHVQIKLKLLPKTIIY